MADKEHRLHQTLHGYRNGHRLLASSVRLGNISMMRMEMLSDFYGCMPTGDSERYYTGYYLEDEGYYVIACTWYASEMNRPGCAWTHSLLIEEREMGVWRQHIAELLTLFRRPEGSLDFQSYNCEVTQCVEEKSFELQEEKIKYIMWAIWGNYFPVIIPVEKADTYIGELLYILFSQHKNLAKEFTFSVGASAIRRFWNEYFTLQIVKGDMIVEAKTDDFLVLDTCENIKEYPLWIEFAYEMFDRNNMQDVLDFRDAFSDQFYKRRYFSMFIKMYLALNMSQGEFEILDCMQIISTLGESDKGLLADSLIDLYLEKYRQVRIDSIGFMRLSMETEWINLKAESLGFLTEDSLEFQTKEAKKFFREIMYIVDCEKAERILEVFAGKVSMDRFETFTDMDIDSCCMLVTLKPELARATCIWRQDREFQKRILSCLKESTIDADMTKRIVEQVSQNSSVDLCYTLYSVFGEECIPCLLEVVCRQGFEYVEKNRSLRQICDEKPDICFTYICEQLEAGKCEEQIIVVRLFDPHKLSISRDMLILLIDAYHNMKQSLLWDQFEYEIAVFYIVLILRSEYKFPDDIISFSFSRVYDMLADQDFTQDEWEKLEYLMPEIRLHNWDRGMRLKKGLEKKGYLVSYY